jgi:predicted Zn-dependent protease
MAEMTDQEMRKLLERALSFSKAEAAEANIFGNRGGNIRYARNSVSTAGATDDTTLVVQSNFGTRTGTVTANEFDDASIERAVRRSEELARLAPEDPEFMPPLGPQQYLAPSPGAYSAATAGITPEYTGQDGHGTHDLRPGGTAVAREADARRSRLHAER